MVDAIVFFIGLLLMCVCVMAAAHLKAESELSQEKKLDIV